MPLTTKLIADYTEMINQQLDNFPVDDVQSVQKALENILSPHSDYIIPDDLRDRIFFIMDYLNEPGDYVSEPANYDEFRHLIRDAIQRKLVELKVITPERQSLYVEEQQTRRATASQTQQRMSLFSPPAVGSEAHVLSIEEWLLEEHHRINRATYIRNLVRRASIPQGELVGLSNTVLGELYAHIGQVRVLIEEAEIPLAALLAQPLAIRQELYQHDMAVEWLLHGANIPLSLLVSQEHETRAKLYRNCSEISSLISKLNMTFEQTLLLKDTDYNKLSKALPYLITNKLNAEQVLQLTEEEADFLEIFWEVEVRLGITDFTEAALDMAENPMLKAMIASFSPVDLTTYREQFHSNEYSFQCGRAYRQYCPTSHLSTRSYAEFVSQLDNGEIILPSSSNGLVTNQSSQGINFGSNGL